MGISAKASEKEAAEKFVKFLFEEESQRASNDEGLAVNSKVYEDMAYWKMGKSSEIPLARSEPLMIREMVISNSL